MKKLMTTLAVSLGVALSSPGGALASDAGADAVVEWNEAALASIREGAPRPTVVSRKLFLLSAAMYDAWAVATGEALPYANANRLLAASTTDDQTVIDGMVVAAAYSAASALWPDKQERFDDLIAAHPFSISGHATGELIAQNVLADRSDDGSNPAGDYNEVTSSRFRLPYRAINAAIGEPAREPGGENFDPNRWQPLAVPTGTVTDENGFPAIDPNDPESFRAQSMLSPHWGNVRTFGLFDPDTVLPPAPPQLGSDAPYTDQNGVETTNNQAWIDQVTEVVEFSAVLDDRGKVLAEFWADGPRSETPPGHWNQLAQGVVFRDEHSTEDSVKMFFVMNGALMDAAIAAWNAKRVYDFIRPQSAIHHFYNDETILSWGGPDLGTVEMLGQDWRPYQDLTFVTPGFPEFVSGHSTFSMAAAEVLTAITGSETFYDGVTQIPLDLNDDGENDFMGQHIAMPGSNLFEGSPSDTVTLQWPTWRDAAEEAGISRLHGGIHIQDGNLAGLEIGRQVAAHALNRAGALFTQQTVAQPGHSGHWYRGEDQSGDGVVIELTANNQLVMSWLTYDNDGEQLWVTGVGSLAEAAGSVDAIATRGGRFGENLASAEVERSDFGTIGVTFNGCNSATFHFDGSAMGLDSGSFAIQRLTNQQEQTCRE